MCHTERPTGEALRLRWTGNIQKRTSSGTISLSREHRVVCAGVATTGDSDGGRQDAAGEACFGFNRRTGSQDAPRWTADQSFMGESGDRGEERVGPDEGLVLPGITTFSRRCHERRQELSGVVGDSGGYVVSNLQGRGAVRECTYTDSLVTL